MLKSDFSRELAQCLLNHYGRIPSAAVVARDFNFRCPQLPAISQETARRWMRGLSLPELERLQVLANWLNMDLDLFFGNGKSRQRSLIVEQNSPSSPKSEPKLDHLQTTLLALVDKMSVANQQLILKLAEELSHSSQATGGPATARP